MKSSNRIASRSRHAGIGIVEIMVGMVIAMVSSLVIFQMLATAESRKRTTSSGSDAHISGQVAMYMIERDLKRAGYGISAKNAGISPVGCTVYGWNEDLVPNTFNFRLAPVLIVKGSGAAPDTIQALSSSSELFFGPVEFDGSTLTTKRLKNKGDRAGFRKGDLLLGVQDPTGTPQCALFEMTHDDDPDPQAIGHRRGNYTLNQAYSAVTPPATVPSKYNRDDVSGPMVAFGAAGWIYNLGRLPELASWSINEMSGSTRIQPQLVKRNALSLSTDSVVSDSIVNLKANYGIDSNGDGKVDDTEWTDTTPTTNATWQRLKAIRFALLVRSGNWEKPNTSGTAYVTPSAPSWYGGQFTMAHLDGTAGTGAHSDPEMEWRNYRYRVFQTTVSFRNAIWGEAL